LATSGQWTAVIFNHGSYLTEDRLDRDDPARIGSVFARHGYVFLFLFRQGVGLSAGQGVMDGDKMARAFEKDGQAGRNRVQLQLLQVEELSQALAGLSFIRSVPGVDVRRVVAAGHSFGGSLTLLFAVLLLHAANDYSIAPEEALAAEMRRLKKPHDPKTLKARFSRPTDSGLLSLLTSVN
jgi:dienelactone hydrolase